MISTLDCILENAHARLAPVRADDFEALSQIVFDPVIWEWTVDKIETQADLENYVAECVGAREQGVRFAYTVTGRTGLLAGVTALGNYSPKDRRIEIGWTWLAQQFWGTAINANAKALLLSLCFERLEMERVEFKTDLLNTRARSALKKIGCTEEGVLRSHTLMHDGRRRDTVYYSILRHEWAASALRSATTIEKNA